MVCAVLCGIVVCLLAYVVYKIRSAVAFWEKTGVPHESYFSYLYTNFVRYKREDIYLILEEYNARYGTVHGTYQGLRPLLRVSTVDGAKDILVKNFSKAHTRTFEVQTGQKLWDNSILSLEYRRWKVVRQLTALGFTPVKLKLMAGKMHKIAKRMSARIAEVAAGTSDKTIDPLDYGNCFALDVIAATAYGLELDAMSDPQNPFVVNGKGVFNPSLGLTLLTSAPWALRYLPFIHYPEKSIMDFFTAFTSTVIKQRRQRGPRTDEVDILDLWLEQQKTNPDFTDDLIAAQTFVFFVAGFETTAFTMHFTLYLLAIHPAVQEMAYKDMIENAADLDNITFEEYNKMKLIEACFLETLRLFPTDYAADRLTVEPCKVAGIDLPAGTAVQVPLPAMQRDADYFDKPHSYCPERFLNSDTQAFLAFGDGPKACLGRRFALLELTIGLCEIMKRVRLVPRPNDQHKINPSGELPLKLTEGMPFLPAPEERLFVQVVPRT